MKRRLLCLLAVLITLTLRAQEETTEQNYTRDLGFNTAFIIQGLFQSNNAPFSVMYKSYSSESKAFRLGLDAAVNIIDSDSKGTTSSNSDANSSSVTVGLTLGKEFSAKTLWTLDMVLWRRPDATFCI